MDINNVELYINKTISTYIHGYFVPDDKVTYILYHFLYLIQTNEW